MATRKEPQSEVARMAAQLQADVKEAVAHGLQVQDKVRELTLRQMQAGSLDMVALRELSQAVTAGAKAGVQPMINAATAQSEWAKQQLQQAVSGLDGALAQLAQASRLAFEEATSKAQVFSHDELSKVRAELSKLEGLYIEALQNAAGSAKDAAGQAFADLAAHARQSGSSVGEQIRQTLEVLGHQATAVGRAQMEAGLHVAQATTSLMGQIASGVFTGLVAHWQQHHKR